QGAAVASRHRAARESVGEVARQHRGRTSRRGRAGMSPRPAAARTSARPHGQIRQSQVVTTFGPVRMVDLPDHAVIISGLEHWTGWRDHPIHEERLAAKVKALLGLESIEFYAPPPDPDDPAAPRTGVTAWLFPEWFIAQYEGKDKETGRRSRPLVHR